MIIDLIATLNDIFTLHESVSIEVQNLVEPLLGIPYLARLVMHDRGHARVEVSTKWHGVRVFCAPEDLVIGIVPRRHIRSNRNCVKRILRTMIRRGRFIAGDSNFH